MTGNRNSGMRPWYFLEPCGTPAAFKRHVRRGEPRDQACKDAHAAEERRRVDALRAAEAKTRLLRGSHREFQRLQAAGEPVPDRVAFLERRYQRDRKRAQRRAAKGNPQREEGTAA